MRFAKKARRGISAIYARTAVANPEVIAWQIGLCTAYCQFRGWTRVAAYADDGYAGTKLAERLQLARLLDDARAGLIERLIVEDLQRLARSPSQLYWIMQKLSECGITVYVAENNEPRSIQ